MMPLRVLANAAFKIAIDTANGSVVSIAQPRDPAAMNWIVSARDTPWQPRSAQWGLGYADAGPESLHRARWEQPDAVEIAANRVRIHYTVGALRVEVTRELADDAWTERYVFTNVGATPLPLTNWAPGSFGVYWPFNDNYTGAADCQEHRAHTHLWCGGSTAWVCALRMGGRGPHLGLVLTEGALSGYSIAGRDEATSSNTRGLFIVHPAAQALAPGASYALGWTIFWHDGWDDFFAQCARRSRRFVRMDTARYTLTTGEKAEIAISGPDVGAGEHARLAVGENSIPLRRVDDRWTGTVPTSAPGELRVEFTADGGIETHLQLNVVPPVRDLIAARVNFIATKQQLNDPGSPLNGAYLVYDNDLETIVRHDWGYDHNEGRERVGMGVLLARWLRDQREPRPELRASLEKYYAFVCEQLQKPDGTVLNGVNDTQPRLYNWPWVMQLHLAMAALTGDSAPLDRFVRTADRFYAAGGDKLYAIGLPIREGLDALAAAGRKEDRERLLKRFLQHGERIAAAGLNYPAHEVNFEQSIVAPAAIILLDLYRVTGDARWLDAARPHLRCLELFDGRQPDHRLHEIAIRHWDGHWFGKRRMWGDTFPHYWSTLTAVAFDDYAAATNDAAYAERAKEILRNNLSLFTPDGHASCAFVYPVTVNGEPAHFADPYANDQDWALVNGLELEL